jgi:hypothetical protein
VELCFQAAGMWEIATTGRMALPTHVDRVVPRAGVAEATAPLRASVEPTGDGAFDAVVIDDDGRVLVELVGYRTTALPGGLDDDVLTAIRDGMGIES